MTALDQLMEMSVPELRRKLTECLSRTVDELKEAANIVRALEEKGEDLSDLRSGLFNYLRLIAYDQLLPEVVVRFAGSPALMRNVAALPLPDQKRLADGGQIELAVRRGTKFDTRNVAPVDLNKEQFHQVFAGGRIRSVQEQMAQLEARPEPEEPEVIITRPSRITSDPLHATMKIGRYTLTVEEVVKAFSGLAPINRDATGAGQSVTIDRYLSDPLKRMAAMGNTTVKHLIQSAIEQFYFSKGVPDE